VQDKQFTSQNEVNRKTFKLSAADKYDSEQNKRGVLLSRDTSGTFSKKTEV